MKIRYVLLFLSYAYIFNDQAMDNQEIENKSTLGYFPAINRILDRKGYFQLTPDIIKEQIMQCIKEPYVADFKNWLATPCCNTIYNYEDAIEVSFTEDKQWCEMVYKDYSAKIFNIKNKNVYKMGYKEYCCLPFTKKTYMFKDNSIMIFFPERTEDVIMANLFDVEAELNSRNLAELSIIKKIYDSHKISLVENSLSVISLDDSEQKIFDTLPKYLQESLGMFMKKEIGND